LRIRFTNIIVALALLPFVFGSVLQLFRSPAAQAQEGSSVTNESADQSEDLQNSGQSEPPAAEDSDQDQDSAETTVADPCLDSLPVPTPMNGAVRVVQLVNCSDQEILGATNAAGTPALPAHYPVLSREGTWIMQAFDPIHPANGKNVLTIDIPPQWASTGPMKSVGPNIWVRTGCRYDLPIGSGPVRNRRLR